jgi:hypothetical protein
MIRRRSRGNSGRSSLDEQLRQEVTIQKKVLAILTDPQQDPTPTQVRGVSEYMDLCRKSRARLRGGR